MTTSSPTRGNGDSGAIGIGTMIVFIAMVIVAAVAAAVLINTSGELQRKSQETGSDTQQEVSGNIFVRDIVGNISYGTDKHRIEQVDYYVSLAPGADPIDLEEMVVRWDHAENYTDMTYADGTPGKLADGFDIVQVYDASGTAKEVLDEGDRVRIQIALNQNGTERVEPRNETRTLFIPETGTPVNADWTAPESFGTKGNVDLD